MLICFLVICFSLTSAELIEYDYGGPFFFVDIDVYKNEYYRKSRPSTDIPYNHGIRFIPFLKSGKMDVCQLALFSASPTRENGIIKNHFYQSYTELAGECRNINGTRSNGNDCYMHTNYDIGYCAPEKLLSLEDRDGSDFLHCKNNPPEGTIVDLQRFSMKDRTLTEGLPVASDVEMDCQGVLLIYASGEGLPIDIRRKYNKKFDKIPVRQSLSGMYNRIKFIKDKLGHNFAGILGSTDRAFYSAIISKTLEVPNIVPAVTDPEGKLLINFRYKLKHSRFEEMKLSSNLLRTYV